MQWSNVESKFHKCIKFSNYAKFKTDDDETSGGIINNGTWGWIANGSFLQIISLDNAEIISTYDFDELSSNDAIIVCVEEIKYCEDVILAIFLQNIIGGGSMDLSHDGVNSILALYSIDRSCILSNILLKIRVTSAAFIERQECYGHLLQYFHGCLAMADEQGIVMLLNLNLQNLLHKHKDKKTVDRGRRHICHIVNNLPLGDIQENLQRCNQEELHFAIELAAVKEKPTLICSILAIPAIGGVAVGLDDGRLVIYDLSKLNLSSTYAPPPQYRNMPIVKLCYLLPLDDPRPSLYVWAVHQSDNQISAVMHGLFYDKYCPRPDGSLSLKDYRKSNICLEMSLESMATHSVVTSCQAIALAPTHNDEDAGSLCMFSWHATNTDTLKVLLFDLNQWYKEEMPLATRDKYSNFTMGLTLHVGKGDGLTKDLCLQVYLNPKTISHYNSVQRAEEHFYPNALSFSLVILQNTNCRTFNWEGSQNRLIQIFQASNAAIFLEVDKYFHEILHANLLPQFNNQSTQTAVTLGKKYDVLLTVALENNCYNLLRDCVHSWSDGSFSGNLGPTTGLSLSVITEWIWRSSKNLEKRCTYLCNGLLEINGYDIDQREQKELGCLTRQLKLLYDLMAEIISNSKRKIPEEVNHSLEKHMKSLHAHTFFYRVVLWLFNIGLLPANTNFHTTIPSSDTAFVYNAIELAELYQKRRKFFAKLCKDSILKRTKSCRLLYIDAFIELECHNSDLHEMWCANNGGKGNYPPRCLADMLRMLLLPNIEFESKCIILMYFFLDVHVMLEQQPKQHYKLIGEQFVKFPSVFQLSSTLMKTVQTFWFIDRACFSPIIDDYISLVKKKRIHAEWVLELLMEVLLVQHKVEHALRVLQACPVIVSSKMKLKTLIANELITEAFHMARSDNTEALLELFFNYCIETGRFGVVRDLTLNEREGHLLRRLLAKSKVYGADNLQFVYLLSRSKYLEAIAYLDELSKRKELRNSQNSRHDNAIETSQLVLSAFNTTIAPMTQGLADTYFRMHNKIKQNDVKNQSDPVPLSCQLIKQNANNLLGGMYHSSALSAHFATFDYDDEIERKSQRSPDKRTNLFIPNNMPFLRRPQVEKREHDFQRKNVISMPEIYCVPNKRHMIEDPIDSGISYNPPKRLRLWEHKTLDVDFMQNYRKTTLNNGDQLDSSTVAKENVKQLQSILKGPKTTTPMQKIAEPQVKLTENVVELSSKELLEDVSNISDHNVLMKSDVPSHESVSVVESPKPRKPLNRESSLKDFACMQQQVCVPQTVVSPTVTSLETRIEDEENIVMEEFKPQISSSKVCETQSKFDQSDKNTTNVRKYTECSTVIGTISYDDEVSASIVNKTSTRLLTNDVNRKVMLETTMDMTSWEEGFLLERDTINLLEANTNKTEQENKEVYFTARSSNWHQTDSGLCSTLNSKPCPTAEKNDNDNDTGNDNETSNLYDFSEVAVGANEKASIILSLEDSDLACIGVKDSFVESRVHTMETQEIHENLIVVNEPTTDDLSKNEPNTRESGDGNTIYQMETNEMSFYQSFVEDKSTSDKNSENDVQTYEEKGTKDPHDNSLIISIEDSDSSGETRDSSEIDDDNQELEQDVLAISSESESNSEKTSSDESEDIGSSLNDIDENNEELEESSNEVVESASSSHKSTSDDDSVDVNNLLIKMDKSNKELEKLINEGVQAEQPKVFDVETDTETDSHKTSNESGEMNSSLNDMDSKEVETDFQKMSDESSLNKMDDNNEKLKEFIDLESDSVESIDIDRSLNKMDKTHQEPKEFIHELVETEVLVTESVPDSRKYLSGEESADVNNLLIEVDNKDRKPEELENMAVEEEKAPAIDSEAIAHKSPNEEKSEDNDSTVNKLGEQTQELRDLIEDKVPVEKEKDLVIESETIANKSPDEQSEDTDSTVNKLGEQTQELRDLIEDKVPVEKEKDLVIESETIANKSPDEQSEDIDSTVKKIGANTQELRDLIEDKAPVEKERDDLAIESETSSQKSSTEKISARRRTQTRGISVPPQMVDVADNSPAAYVTASPMRHRATSLQPLSEIEEYSYSEPAVMPKIGRVRARLERSLQEAVILSPITGSPYQNTRSRMRRNSEESENDTSIISNTGTRSQRSRKSLSIGRETNPDVELVKPAIRKRKLSVDSSTEEANKKQSDASTSNATFKQQRLTRTKLKAFEKSMSKNDDNPDVVPESPVTTTRLLRARSTRSEALSGGTYAASEKSIASSTRSKRNAKPKVTSLSAIVEDETQGNKNDEVKTATKPRTRTSKKQ